MGTPVRNSFLLSRRGDAALVDVATALETESANGKDPLVGGCGRPGLAGRGTVLRGEFCRAGAGDYVRAAKAERAAWR